jgi:hypothetical protein
VVIDAHCHAGKGDGLTGPWDTDASLGRYARRAAAAGIPRTVLYPAFNSDYAQANRVLARFVSGAPRYLGFAGVHPEADRGRVARLVRDAVAMGLRGIKAHRHDARLSREVCEAARTWRLPVVYDVMGEVSSVELFAAEYPDVTFIIPHLGSFADEWRAQRAFIDILARHPNVRTDTSGVRRFDLLAEAVRRAGPAKVIFGSDGPWLHPGVELAKVLALGLPAPALRLVLGGNIRGLLGRRRMSAGPLCRARGRPSAGPPACSGGSVAASTRIMRGRDMSSSTTAAIARVKTEVQRTVDDHAGQILAVSHRIHARPELAFRERHAACLLAGTLAAAGFRVECPAYGLETAFAARAGAGSGPHVVICCEYDALPGLGHACGHNVIAAAGLGAGLALVPVATRIGARLTVLGTPAEEGGAGKELLARRGALRGVDAAMMVHPNAYETAYPRLLAAAQLRVEMHGRAAHASLFPDRGVNALDAQLSRGGDAASAPAPGRSRLRHRRLRRAGRQCRP